MATLKIAKNIHFIICDDIRQEVGNKISLMGIYDDLVVPKIPILLRSFSAVIFLQKLILPFDKIIITLKMPEGKINEFKLDAPKGAKKDKNVNLVLGLAPFAINSEGKAALSIRLPEDDERKIEYTFEIRLAEKKK